MTTSMREIDTFAATQSREAMGKITRLALNDELADDDVAHLARALAQSGTLLNLRAHYRTADIASTGGPSSLSTILCPLYLRAMGYVVPKLGVPGRPAGGVDVLAQVPGYRVDLTAAEMVKALDSCGYSHTLAGADLAPLDRRLFAFRKETGALAVPALVIASILSKKLAVGIELVGLEVRVCSHGNFGTSWSEARTNARRFCRIARLLGMTAVCFLTDGSRPYQPYIGRGEALQALALILDHQAESTLQSHVRLCHAMARGLTGAATSAASEQAPLRRHAQENFAAQGSTFEAFVEKARSLANCPVIRITASATGFLIPDLGCLRQCIVEEQQRASVDAVPFPDPCGVVLNHTTGDLVESGEVLATVRRDKCVPSTFGQRVAASLRIETHPGEIAGYEEVRYA